MDFADECVPGTVPDFGAIFMSNNETRTECFKWKVFGLPFSQAAFVKQVKAGMVIFLFEFVRRELYGVFQACSDGAMNIVSHAFSSSGKQFPAQVKFTTIWKCDPLSEYEFRDAIKENYFSANKFNFGLSEDQVHRLLLLFSRKLKQPLPPRQLTRSKVTKPPGKALRKVRPVVNIGKFVLSDKVEIKKDNDVENDLVPVISTEYSRYSMGKQRRVTDDDRFRTHYRVGNNAHLLDNDLEPSILTEYPGHTLVKENILRDDGRLASSYELGKKCYTGDGFDPVILREHPGKFFGEVRSLADEDSVMTNYKVENNCDFDNGEFHGISSGEARRVADDDKFTRSDRFENVHNLDNGLNSTILSRNSVISLGKVKSVADDGRFRISDRLDIECNLDSGLGSVTSTEFPSLYQFSPAPRVYSSSPSLEINNSLIRKSMPSAFSRSMEPWISKPSYSRSINSSPIPYDPDAPSIQYGRSLSFRVNQSSDSENECTPPDISVLRNRYSSFKDQSFELHMQPKALSKHSYVPSDVNNFIPFSAPNNCMCTYCVASIPPSRAGYSVNKAVNHADYEGYEGLSFSKSSLAPMLVGRSGTHGLKDNGPSLSLSPCENPSVVSDVGYSVVSDEKYKHKTPWRENNEAVTANAHLPNWSQCHLEGGLGSLESTKVNCNETHGFNHKVEYHRATNGVNFDNHKRNSVFSRLTVAPEVDEQENDIHKGNNEDATDVSVDELMRMLHRSHNFWVKKSIKYAVSVRLSEDGESFRDKRHTTLFNQKFRNDSIAVPNQMNLNHTSANEENLDSIDQVRPIVDFKRRSQVRKKVEQTSSKGCVGNAESEAPLSNHPKRRKLVRPYFCNNDLSNDKGIGDSFTSLHESSQQASVIKDNTDNSEAQASLCNQPKRGKLVRPDFCNSDFSNEKANGDSFSSSHELSQQASVIKDNIDNGEAQASLSNQHKRRKLVRPDFRNNDLSNDKGNTDSFTSLHGLSREISVIKDNTDNSEALLGSQAFVHNLSQCFESHAIYQTGSGGNNIDSNGDSKCEATRETENSEEEVFISGGDIDKNGGSKCETERKPESCEESFISGVEDGQNLSQNVVMKNVPFSVTGEVESHKADEGFSGKHIMINGLLQDHNNTCSSDEQKPSLQTHDGDAMRGITLTGIDRGGDHEEILEF